MVYELLVCCSDDCSKPGVGVSSTSFLSSAFLSSLLFWLFAPSFLLLLLAFLPGFGGLCCVCACVCVCVCACVCVCVRVLRRQYTLGESPTAMIKSLAHFETGLSNQIVYVMLV